MGGIRDDAKTKSHTLSCLVKIGVLDEHFWDHCTNFRELVALVMYGLHCPVVHLFIV